MIQIIKNIHSFFIKILTKFEGIMATKNGGRLVLIGIFIFAIILIVGSIYFAGHDNFIEEAAEEIIEAKTGLKIDLTPSSAEINKN